MHVRHEYKIISDSCCFYRVMLMPDATNIGANDNNSAITDSCFLISLFSCWTTGAALLVTDFLSLFLFSPDFDSLVISCLLFFRFWEMLGLGMGLALVLFLTLSSRGFQIPPTVTTVGLNYYVIIIIMVTLLKLNHVRPMAPQEFPCTIQPQRLSLDFCEREGQLPSHRISSHHIFHQKHLP